MERHWILGLVALTTAALLWREVYSIACLSSKRLDNDNGVNGLEDCSNIEECAPDEVCYVEKFVTENNPSAMKYRAGCRNIRDCKLISCSNEVTESVPTPRVGKRYVDEISLCTECCYNDTCNTQGCGSNALDPVRAKYHKKCFNCQHIKEDDHSTCTQMVWCEQPTQVCGISADPVRREYNLKCEFKKLCDQALIASNQSGAPLLLKCFDGHLQNYNPLSNHTATVVADILPCPTGLVPTTPTTTTQKTTTTTTATTTTTTAQKTTTSTTTTPMTPKITTKASTTPRVTTSKTNPITKSTTQSSTVVTSQKTTPTVPMTSISKITTPSPTPTTVKVTTTIKQPTLKTTITPSTTPKRPTLPPLTVTTTLAPTSPNTNSPSLPPVNPTIPIATKVVTMVPVTTTTKALPITTTTTPKPTTTTTTPKPMTTTTPKPTTTNTTPKPMTTTTTPKLTTTTTTPKPTTTTTTPKPTTTTTTPKPTTTTTTPKPTTTTTTPKPTTTSTPKPTTTMKTTTRVTTTPTTTELKTTTKAGPPAGHTIPPNPTVCFVCMDDAPDLCVDLYDEKACEPPNNYCINQVTNYADGSKFVNRTCGNFDRCFKDWYHGSSDTDVCQTFDENQYITLDFECVYCCVKDRCNMQMKPPADTLYEDK